MDWRIVWAASALADVEMAVRYLAKQSREAAELLRTAIFATTDLLKRFPELGAVYEIDESGRTREIVCRPYRIFYRLGIDDRCVYVILVWHSSRREPGVNLFDGF
jgi:plasmid stabilization system protein ParE